MLGMHGTKPANLAIQHCDLLLCVGARFDDRATGKLAEFAPEARVIHMDVDPAEVGKLREADVAILGDLREALEQLTRPLRIDPWRKHCQQLVLDHPMPHDAPVPGVYAPALLRQLSTTIGDELVLACDVGQHQMWVAQHCRIPAPNRHLTSGGLGAMGYGLPAGIGAQLADPDATVVVVSGDGSFMMNLQELVTVRRLDLPLKIVVLDNSALGMVRQWQELFHEERYSEINLSDNPDFAAVARSLGIDAFTVTERSEVPAAIERLHRSPGPILAHVKIDPRQNVWPLVPPGASNSTMLAGPSNHSTEP
jgi:acetolactate synthase-1/2/3 large subunit